MPTTHYLLAPPAATPPLYGQDGAGYDAIVHAHYFLGGCDWLVTEYDPDTRICFGWACLGYRDDAELGYTSLDELAAVLVGPLGQRVEREDGWQPVPLRTAIATLDRQAGR